MTVDLSKIKPGDEVTIRAEFVRLNPFGNPEVRVQGPTASAIGHVLPEAIVSHTPKALAVGDRVKTRTGTLPATVLAIDRGDAWVRWSDNSRAVVSLSCLERAS